MGLLRSKLRVRQLCNDIKKLPWIIMDSSAQVNQNIEYRSEEDKFIVELLQDDCIWDLNS
jgi:hypothetical protein